MAEFEIIAGIEGGIKRVASLKVELLPAEPKVEVEPGYIELGLVANSQKTTPVTIKNIGFATLKDTKLTSFTPEWVKGVVDYNLGDILAGDYKMFDLLFSPGEDVPHSN